MSPERMVNLSGTSGQPARCRWSIRRGIFNELRVAAYCRVSTIREEQLGSLENQIAYYTHYISDKPGWRLVSAYYDRASGMRVSKSGVC